MYGEVIEGFRISPQQKHLWLAQQSDRSAAYRTQCAVLIEGVLDRARLSAAVREVVGRNEILRTEFHCPPDTTIPLQVITDAPAFAVRELDLSRPAPSQPRALVETFMEEARRPPGAAAQGPALEFSLLIFAPTRHVLVISAPALYTDADGMTNMVREISRAYDGGPSDEGKEGAAVQYADAAEIFNELLESHETEAGRDYWRRQDITSLLPLPLPFEKDAASPGEFEPLSLHLHVDAGLTARVGTLAAEYEVSTATVLLACWYGLLRSLVGRADLVVGTAFDGRTYEELQDAVGLFQKYLPLRCHISESASFGDLLLAAAEAARNGYKWQESFSWELLGDAGADADRPSPLPFGFDFAEQPCGFPAGGLTWTIYKQYSCTDRFKVRLSCVAGNGTLGVEFHYDPRSLRPEDCRRLSGRFLKLLGSCVESPEAPLSGLDMVGDEERRQLLFGLNETKGDYHFSTCVHHLFERQAELTPDNTAVIYQDRRLSYRQLNAQANQLARRLQKLGVGPGVLVAVCLERSLDMIVGLLGVLKAGGAYIPLDPSYPKSRLDFMWADAKAPVLLTEGRLLASLPPIEAEVVCLDSEREVTAHESEENPGSAVTPDHLAYVIYTSGSTGAPKGVMISHRSICNRLLWMQETFPLTSADRVLQKTPVSFDASVWEFYVPLLAGAAVVMAEPGGHQDTAYLARTIVEQQVTILQLVPSMLRVFMEDPEASRIRSLRRVFCGGEALTVKLQDRFYELFGASLHNLYGPTEASIDATYWSCRPGAHQLTVPIGRPVSNMQIYLLNAGLQPVPFGVPGELYIGGVGLAQGYLNRPALTAEKFIPHPFGDEPGARLYRSGDLARYLPDGSIEYLGRADHQVKVRGFRIEPGEVEVALRQFPAVKDAVVMAREDGQGHRRLVAYVVPAEPPSPAPGERLYRLPNGLEVAHLNRNETEFIYKEIFLDESYLRHGVTLRDGDCVFDVGANIGLFSLFAQQRCPGARIYAFEPTPPTFAKLQTNADLHGLNAKLYQCGLADEHRSAEFTFYPRMSSMSGVYAERREDEEVSRAVMGNQGELLGRYAEDLLDGRFEQQTFVVELRTLSEVIAENGVERIDLLKLDVEKSELDVLRGIEPEDWPKIKQMVIEVHDTGGRMQEVTRLLRSHGFEFVIEQDALLEKTGIYNIYAIHPTRCDAAAADGAGASPARTLPAPRKAPLSVSELRQFLERRLPEYMVPSAFVTLEALPLAPNGKLDGQALPDPESLWPETRADHVAPRTPAEELLASIWGQVLGVGPVGIHDNFFGLGGDSILAIQIVGRANQAGLRLTPREMFKHQTIAELAAAAGEGPAVLAEQGAVTGDVPLTPIQCWFFEQRLADPHHFNQAMLFEMSEPLEAAPLKEAVRHLLAHHDALRLRFVEDGAGWRQVNAAPEETTPLSFADLSQTPEAEQAAAIERIAAEAQSGLCLARGPLARAVFFDLGAGKPSRLLLVIHHLVVDGVSWRILLEDLQTAYDQARRGEAVRLPPKTTSFKRWAERLQEYARTTDIGSELDYWLAEAAAEPPRLPVDKPGGLNTESSAGVVTMTFDEEETRALLQDVPRDYHAQIEDVLLTALADALSAWTGAQTLVVDVEGHGREDLFDDVDLSRTVGYFTILFPVRLDLRGCEDIGAKLRGVKEQFRRVPNRGIGYGLLKYLRGEDGVAGRLRAAPPAEVSFNYFGNFNQVLSEVSFSKPAGESSGPDRSPRQARAYLLEINAGVSGGRLGLSLTYCENLHLRSTVEALAENFRAAVRSLVARCRAGEAGGYAPSDFPLAQLDEEKLAWLSSSLEDLDEDDQ